MNRKLILLFVFFVFTGRGYSQVNQSKGNNVPQFKINLFRNLKGGEKMFPCPATLWPPFYSTTNNVMFDTIGLWSNYPPDWVTYQGEERIIQFSCTCSSVYRIVVDNYFPNPPAGYFDVFYKPSTLPCTNFGFTKTTSDSWGNILPLDSGITYDIVIDYRSNNFAQFLPGYVNISMAYYPVGPITISEITPDSIKLSWNPIMHNLVITYGPTGFPISTIYAANSPATITGLLHDTKYDFVARQICNTNDIWAKTSGSFKTLPVCDSAQIISCDNTVFGQLFTGSQGYFSLSGCPSCDMNKSQGIYRIIADTSGNYSFGFVTPKGGYTGKMGAFYKDALNGCNEHNWSFITCGTDQYSWLGNLALTAGHTYYVLLSSSTCINSGSVGCCNYFRLFCPSPLCSTPASSLSSNTTNNNICLGQSASLFPVGSMLGTAGLYKWYKDSCSGSVISNTKIITVSPINTTTYFLQITDSCGTLACDSITISLNPNPVPVLSLSHDTTICYYDSLPIFINKNAGDSVQWFKNNVAINAANDSSYYITDAGNYFATVFNTYGCYQSSDTINVIKSIPNNQLNLSGTINLCNGDSITLSADSVTGNAYQWIKDGINIIGAVANTFTVNDSGSYMVFITDSIGCNIYSDSAIVALLDTPQVTITSATNVFCVGDSLLLSVNLSNNVSVQWLFNSTTVSGAIDTTYYANQIGNYTVTVIDSSGCKGTSDSLIVLQSIPVASIIPANDLSICLGDTAQLSASSIPGYAYQWFHDSLQVAGATGSILSVYDSGYYYVSVIDSIGCAAISDSVAVNLFGLPQVSIIPSGTINYYLPGSITINATADSSNSFQWYKNGSPISGAIATSYMATALGIYKVKVTDTLGCENYSPSLFLNSLSGMAMVDTNQQSKIGDQLISDSKLITIIPNPSNSITNVDLSLISGKHFDISLKTITGQTIFIHRNYRANNLMIDVSQLSKGVYILHLTGDINIFKKLIVN